MMTRQDKVAEVKSISDRFAKAKAAFLVDFKGLNVEKVTSLRMTLTKIDSELRVVKNTLAKRALKENPDYDGPLSEDFTGTNGVVFAYDDPSASAKAVMGFIKENDELLMKRGAMDGKLLDENMVKYLAELPSKPELQAKLLGTFAAPMQKTLSLMQNVPGSFVRLLAAYKDKQGA